MDSILAQEVDANIGIGSVKVGNRSPRDVGKAISGVRKYRTVPC